MKILVTDACYVSSDKIFSVFFIRGRNIYYKEQGIDVTVLDFSAADDTVIDGIPVISLKTYQNEFINREFDILVCHAPNIRNHYRFLKKYGGRFKNLVFFFHGHEVLRVSKVYPKPYQYVGESTWYIRWFREMYDFIKLKLWKNYYEELAYKSSFVFVSNWMYEEFLKWVKIDEKLIKPKSMITYNTVGGVFEQKSYKHQLQKDYDFITIRGNLDGSKYCIDIIVDIAKNFPQYKFCIIGKGEFFNHNSIPANVIWIDNHLSHQEVIPFLDRSRCALMPTRTDAQGLMACEMATYGIPLITSDIPVCYEIFESFNNVDYINNDSYLKNFENKFNVLIENTPYVKNKKYFAENACEQEVQLFNRILKSR